MSMVLAAHVAGLTEDEAKDLTLRISDHLGILWPLLLEAHDREAWRALGYPTWTAYCQTEFDMTDRNARYLIDQGRVTVALETATGSALPPISARAAQAVKPALAIVVDNIEAAPPEEKVAVAKAAIANAVEAKKQKRRTTEKPTDNTAFAECLMHLKLMCLRFVGLNQTEADHVLQQLNDVILELVVWRGGEAIPTFYEEDPE